MDRKYEVSVSSITHCFVVNIVRGGCQLQEWDAKLSFREWILFKRYTLLSGIMLMYPETDEQLKVSLEKAQKLCDSMNLQEKIYAEKLQALNLQ